MKYQNSVELAHWQEENQVKQDKGEPKQLPIGSNN
jgi:hypothetical protein